MAENDIKQATMADAPLRRDRHGLLLVPQPSQDPRDPLNWKPWLKIMVLAEISLLSFLSLLSAALIVSFGFVFP